MKTLNRAYLVLAILMIFDEVLKEEHRPEGHYWNHGDSHGVAINKARSEIVYWAESW